ncbi:hypothetical protein SAM19_04321 [Brevibacillus laterosporus]|nr:hypothetical protein [Brevibacillus laterosporus]
MFIGGVTLGIYVGGWLCFIGGIAGLVDNVSDAINGKIKSPEITSGEENRAMYFSIDNTSNQNMSNHNLQEGS